MGPWFHMLQWLHGPLRGATQEYSNAVVMVGLKAKGASITQGPVHVKGSPQG